MLRTILVNPLFNALLLIYAVLPGHDFGVAVIVLTILIRLLLWPLVKKQLYHQKAMKELQPEIAKLKQKAKGDRQKESQMMVELFKEKEINPFGSLGLALLQFPILIALFFVLREIVEPNNIGNIVYDFVAGFGPVKDILANPEGFDPTLFGIVHMAKPNIVLAVLAGLAQYVQARQITPRNTTDTGFAASLGSNMTLIFPILTVAIAIRFPSALALYWFVSSLIAIIQQHIVLAEDVSLMEKLIPLRKKMSEAREFARAFLEDLLSFFGLNTAVEAAEDETTIELSVPSTHLNGFLIGNRGENLRSLQHITNLALKSKGYEDTMAVIDVAGYKKQRNQRLAARVKEIAEQVKTSGQQQALEPMSAYERRVVHQAVSEVGGVASQSDGEGRERRVTIKPLGEDGEENG